ncbi:MAG: hypothetical protein DWH97_08215 [Planctomycetota bacterium]|nr:MAG: hypothetical protein DWH97_08215 [Planctomycetota bacterium]
MPQTQHYLRARSLAALALAGGMLVALPCMQSCNIVTPAAYVLEGPGMIDAEYILLDRKTVVFVDDPRNILPRTSLRTTIGDLISFDLMERKILTSTVATRDAIGVSRASGGVSADRLKSLEAIGRALDCAQVIQIQPTVFDVAGRSDTNGIRPTAIVRVKVIDVEARVRLYPVAEVLPEGREIIASIRESDPDSLRTRGGRAQAEEALAKVLAREIAELFYKHDRIDLGENLGTRKQ